MPKRKAVKGKRGGGTAGRKTVQATAAKDAEVNIDLNSSENAVSFDLETADDSNPGEPDTEPAADDILILNESVLETDTNTDLKNEVNTEGEKYDNGLSKDNSGGSVETVTENYQQSEESKEDGPFEENTENESIENIDIAAIICQQPEGTNEAGLTGEKTESESQAKGLQDDTDFAVTEIPDSPEEKWAFPKQLEEELFATGDSNEGTGAEVCFVDKDAEDDHNEMEDIHYIDEEAGEDQQLSDIMESIDNQRTNANQNSEPHKESDRDEQSEIVDLSEDCEATIDLIKSPAVESHKLEEIDDSKFEEISEGSIDEDQEELAIEAISDVEIIGESFIPKKTLNDKNAIVKERKTDVRYKEADSLEEVFFATENDDVKITAEDTYKEADSLEEVFFATENDDVKITAEDKDNEYISDASLSDHAQANLSLEEISDDDLEPSKKRRKPSGMTPIKAEKVDENTKPDNENASNLDVKLEGVKTNQTNVSLPKRSGSTEIEGNFNKRFKMSGDVKGSEVISRSETDTGLFTIMGSDLKKEGKKPQFKESEASHNRNVLNKRNFSQSSKIDQQESREKSLSSRDLVEQRRRFELVSTGCQTEPRQLKGKIVQCNINPIKSTKEPGLLETNYENGIIVSKLLTKFKTRLPSSIPEKIFAQVTSLQTPLKENTFSFSMGPVTLSDMDCPKFRAVLRGAEEFSLAFDRNCQGILKASHASQESLASLISQLKHLELGNRYMVMSIVYKCGSETNVDVWKATLLFMYEQDIQMENQSLVSDGKIRAKLCLKGVPKGVSKDFIHLLFPEAINVRAGPGTLEERTVLLGVSNSRLVEEILSCYDLLIICGSQINLSHINPAEVQQNLPADVVEVSETLVVEDTECNEDTSKMQDVCVNMESETDNSKLQKELKPVADNTKQSENEGSKSHDDSKQQDQIKEASINSEADGFSGNSFNVQDLAKQDSITEESTALLSGSDTDVTVELHLTETVHTADLPTEDLAIHASNIQDISAEKLIEEGTSPTKKEQNKLDETVVIISEDESSTNCETVDVDRSSFSLLAAADNTKSGNTDDQVNKSDDNIQENMDLLTSTDTTLACRDDVPLEVANKENVDNKSRDELEETLDRDSMEKEVIAVKKEASKETNDENLEDVSDEEMINLSKREDLEDVVILREDSSQWVAAHIDLTNEESNNSGNINERAKDLTKENTQHLISRTRKMHDSNVTTASSDTGSKNVNPKLTMTDGGLEISMEVIDVIEGERESEKVIYARRWRQSPFRSKERSFGDTGNFKITPYAQMPWRENQWSHDKQYPAKEGVSRTPRYFYPGTSREGSPYRAPAREQTAQRRDNYYSKYRRNRSPSPKRDLDTHGHSSSHASDHQIGVGDRRYQRWQHNTYEDSKRTESYSRPATESGSRPAHWQSRSTTYHSAHTRHEDQHGSVKPVDRHSHSDSRGPHYSDRRRDYRQSRSQSYSDMSISSEDLLPPKRKSSYRRESPKRSGAHASRSPISVSSRSRSLSPVSKSPSVEYSPAEAGKEELVKTVKHFLELAKGIQQAQKRRTNRSRSSKSHSKSPLPVRLSSPLLSSHSRKAARSSRHLEPHSPHRVRSRSPKPSKSRHSRSSSYTRRQKYKHERSASPSSRKRHRSDRSYSNRRGNTHKKSESPVHRYESKKSQRTGDISKPYEEQGSRSKSGQYSESKYKSSSDQSWQQSYGGYQPPQSSGQVPSSNIYNPPYPPPACPPQQQTGMYSGSSMPVYSYNNPSQYNYSNIQPPFVHTVPPSSASQPYQSSHSVYQPQPYSSTGHHNAPLQTSTTGGTSSNNSSSKNKKSWSMGSKAMLFQRVLGSDHKGGKKNKSGIIEKIEERERLERPKYSKFERVLTTIHMERK